MPRKKSSSNKPSTRSATLKRKPTNTDHLIHSELVQVRDSPIHGRGVYAVQPIKAGTRVYEYVGERISHSEADRRFWRKRHDDGHTFLFVVNRKTVIDGSKQGNDARYINHRCEANCETVTENNRIYVETIKNIKTGEELGYDYQLTWSEEDTPDDLALYRCLCGSKQCRGTMLDKQSIEQHLAEERAQRLRAKNGAANAAKKKPAKKTPANKKSGKRSSQQPTKRSKR